ncbi:MAG: UvrD-helicase domain-containing protein [Fusobacteriaceae bacterium]
MDFSTLNKEQLEAVKTISGPLLILAGPGTGKTFTIVKRVANLIIHEKVNPKSILVTTFTKKAAKELKFKIALELKESNINIDIEQMKIGTIHSILQGIIKTNKQLLLDEFQQKYLLHKNIHLFESIIGYKDFISKLNSSSRLPISTLLSYFSKLSEYQIDITKLYYSSHREIQLLGIFYSIYQKILEDNQVIDFSKIQTLCYDILVNDKELLFKLKKEITHIIVDEYQDTNSLQNKILFLLAGEKKNICAVGDDDQSIYRFRGASVENILNFSKHFEKDNCKIINLKENYRSQPEIINFYSSFIKEKNWKEKRVEKFLFSSKKEIFTIPKVMKISGKSNSEYAANITSFIKYLKENNIIKDYSEIVFLSSSAKYSDFNRIIHELNKNNIKTYSPRTGNFFQRDEIKFTIGLALVFYKEYFNKIYKDKNNLEYEDYHAYYRECINYLKNYCSNSNNNSISKWLKIKLEERNYKNFLSLFYESFKFDYFKEIFSESNINEKEYELKEKNLSLLARKIFEYEEKNKTIFTEEFFDEYLPFLIECGVFEYEDEEEKILQGHISFLTLHQSKGLEFPIVFLTNLIDKPKIIESNNFKRLVEEEIYGINSHVFQENSEEDFYRLYYTGFSRAKNFLFLSSLDNRLSNVSKPAPSNFFSELFNSLPEYHKHLSEFSHNMIESSPYLPSKKRFSFTGDIALYTHCPTKYRFLKYSFFPIFYTGDEFIGTLVHNTIDSIHKNILNKIPITKKEVILQLKQNYNFMNIKHGINLNKDEKEKILKDIFRYLENSKDTLIYINQSELSLSTIRENYVLYGNIDLLMKNNGIYDIVDFKTSKEIRDKIPENYKKQLIVYEYLALSNNYNVKNLKIYYTSCEENPIVSVQLSENFKNKVLNEFDIVVSKILNKEFFYFCSNKSFCLTCQFKYFCNNI